ncbi:polysaccharide biosynthesis protein [Clostridium sp. D2Q-14]|uniref:putative polysaccharide biosynthesis protein n=1 Tax=Anaeromonas gelatinilytica TaxID=2683194 RepID=UPI00193B263C|nr:polysaccharide biosynthesis protein [Anaeromonas gelatinilytica]MBS4535212.1 polysaccharide biosynthesis protein [Anaeromonas gelatinilytica]
MNKRNFIYGSIILAMVNFLVRIMGFGYKIILSKLIGPSGIGLFQLVLPILSLFITITTAGMPIAVTKLVVKEESKNNSCGSIKILKTALLIAISLSIILSAVLLFSANYISTNILKNKDILYSLYFLIPAICIISISGIIRGYFYGLKKMTISGIAQIIEQISRIVFVILYLYYSYPVDSKWGAFIAIVGISFGELFGLFWLLFNYSILKVKKRKKRKNFNTLSLSYIIRNLFFIAIPITISRLINVIFQLMNSILIPQRLIMAGYSHKEAVEIFGRVLGMTIPLIFLPFIVTSALVINIIPNISELTYNNKIKEIENDASLCIRLTLLIAIPITYIYIAYSAPLGEFIYNDPLVGKYLGILGYSTIFLSLHHTLSGILHGLNKQIQVTINYIIGMTFQILAIFFLVSNSKYGIYGYFIGFLTSAFIICTLDFITLKKYINFKINLIDYIIKPLLSSAIMIQFLKLSDNLIYYTEGINIILHFFIYILSFCLYFLLLIITKSLPLKIILNTLPKYKKSG